MPTRDYAIYCFRAVLVALSVLCFAACCEAQDANYGPNPASNTLTPTTVWSGPNNQFVTATLEDSSGWWWGTDNDGLWHYAPGAKLGQRWKHIRAEDGLYDDSITSLCIDRKGRLWVGTERRGVSVYNNSWWQNYDYLKGPLGVHVNTIALNPVNGDVWTGSECGIAIYSDKMKTWRYITEANGLTSNEINCISFTASGEAIIGTADSGVLLGVAATDYATWNHITANPVSMTTESGSGLPSNQIDCEMVTKAGKIFCGTSCGLCYSKDSGKTWTFLHGWEWQLKAKRAVKNTAAIDWTSTVLPLSDDYVSALAYDRNGYLYVGHRQGGLEVIDDSDGTQLFHTRLDEYGTCIRSLTVLTSNAVLVGNYGDGASAIRWTDVKALPEFKPAQNTRITTLPVPAEAPSARQLAKMASDLKYATNVSTMAAGYFLGEEWQTQGNWMGRYGREYSILCGADDANKDFILGDQSKYSVTGQIGIALNGSTSPSHWLQWEQSSDPRVLFDPEVHTRRESEWDDQGEQDDRLIEGPDIWLTVKVPGGDHRLSLYFMNKDGHTRSTRFRDFIVQLIPAQVGVDFRATYDSPTLLPAVAETRVENFWPGVYERFEVSGPGTFYVKIDRNYSLNTIIQGVFIDPLGGKATAAAPPWMPGFDLTQASVVKDRHLTSLSAKAMQVWSTLDSLYGESFSAEVQRVDRIQLLRACVASKAPESDLTDWRLELGLWNDTDWNRFSKLLKRAMAVRSATPTK
jgi:hypothetical protein